MNQHHSYSQRILNMKILYAMLDLEISVLKQENAKSVFTMWKVTIVFKKGWCIKLQSLPNHFFYI